MTLEAPKLADASEGLLANLDNLLAGKPVPEPEKKEPPKPKADEEKPNPEGDKKEEGKQDGLLPDNVGDETAKKTDDKKGEDDEEIPAEIKSDKAKADWKGLRDSRRKQEERAIAAEKKIADLERQIAESPNSPERVAQLEKQIKEYDDRLTVTAVEQHPKFRAYFEGKAKALLETAKNVGGEKIAALLLLPDSEYRTQQLSEIYADLSPVAQSRIGAVLNQFDELKIERQNAIAKAGDTLKALQDQNEQQRKAEAEAQTKELDTLLSRWSDPEKGNPIYQSRKDDPEWETALNKRRDLARQIFNGKGMTVQDLARAAAWAAAGPDIMKNLAAAHHQIKELNAEIASLKAAKPTIEKNGNGHAGGEDDSKLGWIDASIRQISKL